MSDEATKARMLSKIKKCLALSKSSNEHEAAAALRQAQKLMELHGICEAEVELVDFGEQLVVVTDYAFSEKRPMILLAIVDLIKHAMGVTCTLGATMHGTRAVHSVRYFGPISRVVMAAYAHEVVYAACKKGWRRYLAEEPELTGVPGARASYFLGWCMGVRKKVAALVATPDEEAKTKAKMDAFYGKSVDTLPDRKIKPKAETFFAGRDDSEDFDLHRPVGQDRMRLHHDKEKKDAEGMHD